MADKNPIEAGLAAAVHQAEYDYGQAISAPAGPGRIEKINRTADALLEAEQIYEGCLSGSGFSIPVKR